MNGFARRHVLAIGAGTAAGSALGLAPTAAGAAPQGPAGAADENATADDWGRVPDPVPVPLTAHFDNDGVDTADARGGNFDGSGYTYPGEELPAGPIEVDGFPFDFPGADAGAPNNIVAMGQRVELPPGHYLSVLFLASSSYGTASGEATVHYADGSTATAGLSAPDWYSGGGSLRAPYRYAPNGTKDPHQVSIAVVELGLDPVREAVALTLPVINRAEPDKPALHIFALSLQPVAEGRAVALRNVRSTTASLERSGAQSVEATLINAGAVWIAARDGLSVTVDTEGARTVAPVPVPRLGPGEQARVTVGIRNRTGVAPGTVQEGRVLATGRGGTAAEVTRPLTLGVPDFEPTDASLSSHQAPYWFNDAKFGIFIHWGVYSVPAWAPVGKQYAEWYWQQMNQPDNPTHAHHREVYGEDFAYDDFIPMFRAERFNPRSWVELFRDAGAQYHVLTSKHHEGFALWDTKLSTRNSVAMGPRRDLIRELFDASRRYTPDLHCGLYFSMPEWFNPDNPWYGHAPRNPYTLEPVPYTGYTSGQDYVRDYQAGQMLELIREYDTEIMWCDIGGDNDSHRVLAEYFNHAKNRPRPIEVTVNNRSGIGPHDFSTPEYEVYENTVVAKWEASRGLDPRSYGYNAETPDDAYMTTEEVVHSLVDIVSKNGNFLLDIGPRADGTIPEIMERRLRETGEWLRVNGEAIYGTTYWSRMAQLGEDLRFTMKRDAFYIHSLAAPSSRLVVEAPVPLRAGDEITMLGYGGRPLNWDVDGGALVVEVPAAARRAGKHAWVFKVSTRPSS